jgi:hypothetical protein
MLFGTCWMRRRFGTHSVTGPFHVDGAEPGDTLALHFARIEPARDWEMSSTFPHFGALTTTHTTAMLHAPLEERVWRYEIDVPAGTVTYRALRSAHTVTLHAAVAKAFLPGPTAAYGGTHDLLEGISGVS